MSGNESRIARLAGSADSGILNERVLLLVFESMKWDIHTLCRVAAVNCKLRAVAKRILWREICLYRAPRMMSALADSASSNRIIGGWHALAKLLFFCGGCESTRHFKMTRPSPGHFVQTTRFSKTSGRSFLKKRCRADVLYVSDPCEHAASPGDGRRDDVGIYRGVFRSFMKSRTRECLIRRRVEFEERVRCPYCGARVWSMVEAGMVPRKIAARRLGSSDDALEYFVCLNGHLHGACWLVHLSSDDDGDDDEEDSVGSDEDGDNYGGDGGDHSGGGSDRNHGRIQVRNGDT